MHRLKTGALLAGQRDDGRGLCHGRQPRPCRPGKATARRMGLAFQVVDDILDVTADSATLGKTAGKDAANDKPTYVSLLGLDARAAVRSAVARTSPCGLGRSVACLTCAGPGGFGSHGGAQLALSSSPTAIASCVQIDC